MILALMFGIVSVARSAEPLESLLRDLPPGIILQNSLEVPADQLGAMGEKLGGRLTRVTNSNLRVHGRGIKLNLLTAADESNAQAIHAALLKIKPYPFCLRKGPVVVEYVGNDIDAPLAIKTSYELGIEPKPDRIRYRVVAEIATIDDADYMACNPLFNQLLALKKTNDPATLEHITELSKRIRFGRSLVLRDPKSGSPPARYRFQPAESEARHAGATVRYVFDELPTRHAIPYVTATLELTADATGLTESRSPPGAASTAATPFWPAADPDVIALARRITEGKTSQDDQAMALVEWLAPGRNLKYSGQTGSRWGTQKVLAQKSGHCWDFSDCFVTLARALGIPSRQVAGWLYATSGHVWAEYYRDGKGWQQVDPTGGGKLACGIYHLAYFTSNTGEMPIVYLSLPAITILPVP